jgi:hypothetical protein
MTNTLQYNVVLMTYKEKQRTPLMHGYIHAVNQIHTTIYDLPTQNSHCLLALKVAFVSQQINSMEQEWKIEEYVF